MTTQELVERIKEIEESVAGMQQTAQRIEDEVRQLQEARENEYNEACAESKDFMHSPEGLSMYDQFTYLREAADALGEWTQSYNQECVDALLAARTEEDEE